MISEQIFKVVMASIKQAKKQNIEEVSKKVLDIITPLCEKFGYNQDQLLQIRKAIEDAGGDGAILQDLLEETKFDNVAIC